MVPVPSSFFPIQQLEVLDLFRSRRSTTCLDESDRAMRLLFFAELRRPGCAWSLLHKRSIDGISSWSDI